MACSADPDRDRRAERERLAGQSRTVAFWILISRVTGFGRVAIVAAVLGPTWFGNLFQIVAVLPVTLYGVLAGSQFSGLLVPLLVAKLDRGDAARTARLANGALGVLLTPLACLGVFGLVLAPGLLSLLTLGISDAAVRTQALQSGLPLLYVVLPQIALYCVVGTGIAVQQAHGRFALAAAASTVENLGVIAVFVGTARLFGAPDGSAGSTEYALLLGGGSTAAVLLHAALQWWGARRVGIALRPLAGWRDPELRAALGRGVAMIGYSALYWLAFLAVITAAAAIPGGAVAFQIAHSCCQVPIALTATPLATTQLPFLSRISGEQQEFARVYSDGVRLALFAALPAAVMLTAIPGTIASAIALGKMATPGGVGMIAAFLASMSLGVVAEAVVVLSTGAAYARRQVMAPLRAMAARLAVVGAGVMVAHATLSGETLLWGLGAAIAVGNFTAAAWLHLRQTRPLRTGRWRPGSDHVARLAIQLVSLAPALAIAGCLGGARGTGLHHIMVAMGAVGASLALYVFLHRVRGSHELHLLLPLLARPDMRERAGAVR